MEKIILLILISLCLNPAWGAEFTIGQDSELILDRGGRLQALPSLLPPGSIVEIDDSILASVESNSRAHQQRYTDSQGQTKLSQSPLLPKVKVIHVPGDSPYPIERLNQYDFYMSLQSLKPAAPPTESERVANFLGIQESQVQLDTQSQPQTTAQSPDSNEAMTPMISQPSVEVLRTSAELSENARKELYPPICGCTDCNLMTAHGESSCNALEVAANSCSEEPLERHDGNRWLAPANLPIHAPCDGEVVFFGATNRYGRQLVLACEIEGQNYHFRFNHINAVTNKLKESLQVTAGQPIAIVGDTGTDKGYHLAHQIHLVQDPKLTEDPENTFKAPEQNPNVIKSIDPSYFYTNIASTELGVESELKDEYRSQILARDCPATEQQATTQAPASETTQAVQ